MRILAAACALLCACPPAGDSAFRWGVNGHPLVQEAYTHVSVATQIDLVAELGARWYRCDWDQGRLERSPEAFDALVEQAAARGIRILPVIFPSPGARSEAAPEQIRAAAFEFARALASRFRGRITHWELDNELDLVAMIRKGERTRTGEVWQWGDPDGDRPEHYEETRYQRAKAELVGLYEGIKAADPTALTIVDNGGWLHYGFFERLVREDGVPFDILGLHWYSEMGDPTKVRVELDLIAHLRGYGKPIWITETNRRGGSLSGKHEEQAQWLERFARQMRGCAGVEAFFAYELLDEPYFGTDNPESHYGLVEVVPGEDGRWQVGAKKNAFGALAKVIRELPTGERRPNVRE